MIFVALFGGDDDVSDSRDASRSDCHDDDDDDPDGSQDRDSIGLL